MIVVKLGGSLFDHPHLGPGLRDYLAPLLRHGPVRLVPGGGPFADAVRHLEGVHRLGDEAAHWIALRSLSVSARFVASLLGCPVADDTAGLSVIDGYDFARRDDGRPGSLPHTWDATSDSLAARVAAVGGATRLILLKSIAIPPGTPWPTAAAHGWVDGYFPTAVASAPFPIEVMNFRRRLDEHFSPGIPTDPHRE